MRYILLLLLGLGIGAAGTVFFLGVPSARAVPGTRVQAPPRVAIHRAQSWSRSATVSLRDY